MTGHKVTTGTRPARGLACGVPAPFDDPRIDPRIDSLRQRARIIRALRAELDGRGFVEVQTPVLVPGTCPDRAIASFEVPGAGYLVSSTEYQLKRLFAEGLPAAYTLGPNFRAGDLGERHNPEFTMLEWGRSGANMREVEAEAEAMVRRAGEAVARPVRGAFRRVSVRDALRGAFGRDVQDWDALVSIPGPFAAGGRGDAGRDCGDDDAHLSWLIDEALRSIDPERPTWIVGWPASMTTSAGLDPRDPSTTLRSELYWQGVELSDGFPFSSDAAWQRQRSTAENAGRVATGLQPVALDERFLTAVADLPAGAGMAMGVDRLCLALFGKQRLGEVMAFTWGER